MPIGINPGMQYRSNKSKSSRENMSIRLLSDERKLLDERAARYGMSTSAYCRMILLETEPATYPPDKEIASLMCKHNVMVEKYINDTCVRNIFHKWEEEIWQLLK